MKVTLTISAVYLCIWFFSCTLAEQSHVFLQHASQYIASHLLQGIRPFEPLLQCSWTVHKKKGLDKLQNSILCLKYTVCSSLFKGYKHLNYSQLLLVKSQSNQTSVILDYLKLSDRPSLYILNKKVKYTLQTGWQKKKYYTKAPL